VFLKELWVPLSGAIAQQRKIDTIANNIANINTPGFKKDQLVFKEYLNVHEQGGDINLPNKEWKPGDFYKSHGAEHGMVKVDASYSDHSQGQLVPTNSPLDLAIHGNGYFEILTPQGIRYTRRGSLSLDSEGNIITNQGHKLLSRIDLPEVGNGQEFIDVVSQVPTPEQRSINIGKGTPTINLNGEVFINGEKVSKISVVEFKDPGLLKKQGQNVFINDDARNIVKTSPKSKVHQGFEEQSNVNSVQEMSELIKSYRQFESIQRAIKAYDSMSGKAINEITKF
jgi:flagellar basal-body rod protein FlgG